MSLSCPVHVCADLKSHISTCLCWERRALSYRKIYIISSLVSNVIDLPYTVGADLKSLISICHYACAEKEGHYHTERPHKNIKLCFKCHYLTLYMCVLI